MIDYIVLWGHSNIKLGSPDKCDINVTCLINNYRFVFHYSSMWYQYVKKNIPITFDWIQKTAETLYTTHRDIICQKVKQTWEHWIMIFMCKCSISDPRGICASHLSSLAPTLFTTRQKKTQNSWDSFNQGYSGNLPECHTAAWIPPWADIQCF